MMTVIPSITTLPPDLAKDLRGVFFDIDDTFTTQGTITRSAFEGLWRLRESGLLAVPITGRPAGWCDHIARMWPVDGVVGENGAFYFRYDRESRRLLKRFMTPDPLRREHRRRLEALQDEILASVPGTAPASDQPYRETDLAIDYCEDVEPLPWEEVERICAIFSRHGAKCKVSSIHVNGWFGEYDKLSMTRLFVEESWNVDMEAHRHRYLFCGDSPNDEPMFGYFPCSAGVHNVLRFAHRMRQLPAFVAELEGGEGFAQIVETILRRRETL